MALVTSPPILSFAGGELSRLLDGRADLDIYHRGARELFNTVALPEGPAQRRSGTLFIAPIADETRTARLLPFVFNESQAYQLEFGHQTMRVFMDRAQVLDGFGAPYQIATPYDAGAVLQFEQSADVLFTASPDHWPRRVLRHKHDHWTIEECPTEDGPYLDENTAATTITASATTGTVTLTASADLWQPGHVGAHWRVNEEGASRYDKWESGKVYAAGDRVWYDGRVYETAAGGTSGKRSPLHDEGVESDGGVDWTYLHSGSGWVKITGYTDARTATAEVRGRLPDGATAGTKRWQEGAWSTVRGFPRAVCIHQERLIWAGTGHQPRTVWGSKTGDWYTHSPGDAADDAFARTLGGGRISAIRWLSGAAGLFAGTGEGVWRCATPPNEPLKPDNQTWANEVGWGAAALPPVRAGRAQLYVQRRGRTLRELSYSLEADGLDAVSLTVLASHIAGRGVTEMAWQETPGVLWGRIAAGTLAALTYDRDEKVVAWHRHATAAGDVVEAVSVIPGAEGDELWLVVARQIGGATRRYVEVMEHLFPDDADQADAHMVDCGVVHDGAPVDTITGLDHLEGRTVQITADGATLPEAVVEGGAVSLGLAASKVHVGLAYESRIEPMRLEPPARGGTSIGKVKRISKAVVRLYRTLGALVGRDDDSLEELDFRSVDDAMDAAPPLMTGDHQITFPDDYGTEARVLVVQRAPQPLTVVCIVPEVGVYEG